MLLGEDIRQINKHQKEIAVVSYLIGNEKYQNSCLELIKKDYNLLNSREVLDEIFSNNNTTKFVLDNLKLILATLKYKTLFINYFLNYSKHMNKELYKLIAYNTDLEVRAEVMHFYRKKIESL